MQNKLNAIVTCPTSKKQLTKAIHVTATSIAKMEKQCIPPYESTY